MQKFFVNPEQIQENTASIVGEDVNHIVNVLRLELGEKVLVGNKISGDTYNCEIRNITKEYVLLDILNKNDGTTEPNVYLHVFQGLPKADKMENIIQKCTEIGVSEFTPVAMSRCIVKLDEKESKKKLERWQKIAETAAKQSKRDIIPKINFAQNLKNIYEKLKECDIVLIAYEDEKENSLKSVLKKHMKQEIKKVAIIIGPEGGLERQEVEAIKRSRRNCSFIRK